MAFKTLCSFEFGCNFIKKETPVRHNISCEISKNAFFHRTPLTAASGLFIYALCTSGEKSFYFQFDKI